MMESRALPATLAPISARRRRVDRLARWTLGVASAVALVPLMLVLYYLIKRGIGVLSLSFFTTDPTGAFLGDLQPTGFTGDFYPRGVVIGLGMLDLVHEARERLLDADAQRAAERALQGPAILGHLAADRSDDGLGKRRQDGS